MHEKLSSHANSALKNKEGEETNSEKFRRQSSYISQGSQHQLRMRDTHLDHPKALGQSKHPIIRICLTGGPCAGKTTALTTLNQTLTQLGFRVLIVPEAATMLMKGGAMIQTHKLAFSDAVKF